MPADGQLAHRSTENQEMNIGRKWKKFLVVGCSHGQMADPKALAAVLKFKESFKPHFTAHLGDAFDTTAFRAGAKGTRDEYLNTLIHEVLHHRLPNASESKVCRIAGTISEAIWKARFRRLEA